MDRKGLWRVILLMATPLTFVGSAGADPAPAASADRVEQVRIPSAPGVVLYGELRLPAGPHGRYPLVLLLGGGGASPHGIYPLLEARLHAKGIATFSFDKRGVGQSTGAFQDAIELAEQDARAVLAHLRSRTDVIDVDRVAILGLSQGAVIAPVLAVENPFIAALVLLAAPAGEQGRMFLDAMREKLAASGMAAQAVDNVVEATRHYLDALTGAAAADAIALHRAGLVDAFVKAGWRRDQAEGAVKTLADPATASLYRVAASKTLSQVKAPVLAIYAADDTVVSTSLSIAEARRALTGNADAHVVEMPNVEHGFKPLVATASGRKEYAGWPISDPATLDVIDAWLPKRVKAPLGSR